MALTRSRDPNAEYPEGWVFCGSAWRSPECAARYREYNRQYNRHYRCTVAGMLAALKNAAKRRGEW